MKNLWSCSDLELLRFGLLLQRSVDFNNGGLHFPGSSLFDSCFLPRSRSISANLASIKFLRKDRFRTTNTTNILYVNKKFILLHILLSCKMIPKNTDHPSEVTHIAKEPFGNKQMFSKNLKGAIIVSIFLPHNMNLVF